MRLHHLILVCAFLCFDRLCGLVVRVFGYRFRPPGFDFRRYQIFWVVHLERGPLSLVRTIEELLGRKSSGSGLEKREYCCRDQSRWPRGNFYQQKLALTSPTSHGRSVCIVRSRTQTTEFVLFVLFLCFKNSSCLSVKVNAQFTSSMCVKQKCSVDELIQI
jgi:hypothetical protein